MIRVFIGSSCGEPQHLVNALMDNAAYFSDVEIIRLLSLEGSLLTLMADEYRGHKFHIRSIYQGSDQTKSLRANKRFITPMTLCAVPDLFKKRLLPVHVALIQVSPPDGKSIVVIPARSIDGNTSRIIATANQGSIVVPKGYVSYVVSEYGMVNLFGKNIEERAMAMISLAHPDFRYELFHEAQEAGFIDRNRTLSESLFGIYLVRMEETREYEGQPVTFRPAKAVDGRLIQEHFYTMEEKDVQARFFGTRKSFFREDMQDMFQVDYIKNLTIVAVTGEIGFEKIIGIGEYALEQGTVAEVAFSVSKEWQGKGIASVILEKVTEAALENGFTSLIAYTQPINVGMIKLFERLPYKVETILEDNALVLRCNFEVAL